MTLVLKESEAVIYNRRTGDVVEKKVFAPDAECPTFTFTRKDQRDMDGHIPYTPIQAWARSRIKR
jgi:hypothetical protein